MIDRYDSETIVKIYRLLKKRCEAIDQYIKNHAYYFGPCSNEYGSIDVLNNIMDLMTRKNELINLKLIIDDALNALSVSDRQVLYIKMNYNISINEICGILELSERTAFRHIERAFDHFAEVLNKSKYSKKLELIMDKEDWIAEMKESIIAKRMNYRSMRFGQ